MSRFKSTSIPIVNSYKTSDFHYFLDLHLCSFYATMPDCSCVSLVCCPVQLASQHREPLQEQQPVFPEQTSLTRGKVFVKLLIEGSNATNYLGGVSQPSYCFDR